MNLFRTKPTDVNANTGLKRCLGAFDLTMLGIGCIIGTGSSSSLAWLLRSTPARPSSCRSSSPA